MDDDDWQKQFYRDPTQQLTSGLRNISETPTRKLKMGVRRKPFVFLGVLLCLLILAPMIFIVYPRVIASRRGQTGTPKPFDPAVGAVLPNSRVIAFYAIPNAEATGPAYQLSTDMLNNLQAQGAEYQKLDPKHPVKLGIDLVVSIPDGIPGPDGTYSHHLDADTIQSYIDFCKQNDLILFLDLNFGWSPIGPEVDYFLSYLERYTFVHLAIDPEWMFPRHDGIPGVNLSNVRASDLNPIIQKVAAIPMKYHVPRKILLIHQYRSDGDGLQDPYDAGQAEIADKRNLISDPRVDVVIHVDSVGGYNGDKADKTQQYNEWVAQDIQKYHNFRYGGFKLFYQHEAQTLMTPQEVLALKPAPMIVTYGN
ncbi:MAG TPA: hypothetical protein VFN35_03365 [Ktedonobacteraceae bacterium]|nr:hypothetical protein [Ktedonobacteraceae bacterium]